MTMSKLRSQMNAPCRVLLSLAFLLFTIHCSLFTAHAQTTNATLSGVVEDEKGAIVPGAKISIMNPATGLIRTVVTDESGSYVVPLLPPAKYTVMAEATGFRRIQIPDVVLNVNDRRSLRIELQVGEVGAEVLVRPDESLINVSPEVSTRVDRTFVGNLPLSGRTFQSLILLTPGIVPYKDFNSSGEFSVNGQRTNANYFSVDGVSANTGIDPNSAAGATSNAIAGQLPGLGATGSTSSLVSVDALEEFKIQTSTYSAQFGRQPGAQVQLSTRSGTNDFHGSLFEYIRNEAFDARNYFNKVPAVKPPTRLNQFGGTFSGPIYLPTFGDDGHRVYSGKNRTFFFLSFEAQRLRVPSNANRVVPSLRLRGLAPAQFEPILNAFPLPTGDEILATCDPNTVGCSPNGTRLSGMSPFLSVHADPKSQDATSIRIDHKISDRHSVFGRYNYAPSDTLTRYYSQLYGSVFKSQTLTLGSISSLASNISNDFRFNYTKSSAKSSAWLDNFGGAVPIEVGMLLPGYSGELKNVQGRFALDSSAGSSEIFIGDVSENQQVQYNFVDNLTWVVGSHSLTFGFDYRRLSPIVGPLQYSQSARGSIFDQARETLFLNGNVASVSFEAQGSTVRPRFDNISVYVQDTWKASRRLTLDLGLRWELNPTPSEASGRNPVFVTGVENMATVRLLRDDEPWYKTDYRAFSPRFGAAFLLRQQPGQETVLRGGFGVYYDLNSGLATSAYGGFPFRINRSICCNLPWPLTPAQAVLPPNTVTLPITSSLYSLDPDLKLPYTLQWNFSVEQSLGKSQTMTVGYVASAGRRLTIQQILNRTLGQPARPNPSFGDINYVTNGPTSDYHSMQAQYQRRLSKGLQALVNYTWSHAIDEVSNEFLQGTLVRGNADFDVRHNFSTALTYNVPRWKRFSFVDAVLRDWAFDTVIIANSGTPLDIKMANSSERRTDGRLVTVRPDLVPGVPFWVEDGNVPGGRKINLAAFAPLPRISSGLFAREGSLGRNVVRAPGLYQVNLSVRRQFGLNEHVKLDLRAEAFNLFNTPHFAGYRTDILSGGLAPLNALQFGHPTTTLNSIASQSGGLNSLYSVGGPRSMQFSARLIF